MKIKAALTLGVAASAMIAAAASHASAATTCTSDGYLCYSAADPQWSVPSLATVSMGAASGPDGAVTTGYNVETYGPADNQVAVTFYGNAGVYQGSTVTASAPTTISGVDANKYFAVPTDGGNLDANFANTEQYVGFLWGNVQAEQAVTAYDGTGMVLDTIYGSDILAAAGGNAGFNGSYFVNIEGGPADNGAGIGEVYFQTVTNVSFSVDQLTYSEAAPVPLPALAGTLPGMVMLGLGVFRRRTAARSPG
jgi:hypothetical protein